MCQSRIVGISSKWEKDLPLRGRPSIAATQLTTSWLTKPQFFPDAA